MSHTSYNDIAGWYDQYIRESPLYRGVFLPQFWDLLGDVEGQTVCDLACGQGWIARELARRGAHVTGIDLAENLLALAKRAEEQKPLGIVYLQGDAQNPQAFIKGSFDGLVCVLSLMDIADLQAVFQTMQRMLKPGGWLVFAITHPCFQAPHAQWITTDSGEVARVVRGYFKEGFWMTATPGGVRSRVGAHHRMLSTYLNALVAANFTLEQMLEPMATGERARQVPGDCEVPSLLLIRAHLL
ncbi:class I SAM-dependent methyltransferase [Ktedonosporobacter rubrisoli]|uniref:Class I SAM-dependent methyltransferase n=1 Tax=Ktedonosporobacter rubrisoli TaxID=2509675 RepID=A0A4P6JMW6_KTERU|nr:class I SAM-dependent methyltransferase [Ktedonosporobacter rubrisoli]QBD76619.1 class I SAM-dependent methyltransferase [Ktedonosporobacter rubrisoli]